MGLDRVKALLDAECARRNDTAELCDARPDPLLVARDYRDPSVALICALFGYGSVVQIVRFLRTLDFSLLEAPEPRIREVLQNRYYRFQKADDLIALFIALRRLGQEASLEEIFLSGYRDDASVLEGIEALIRAIEGIYRHASRGYRFLLSRAPSEGGNAPYKRWNMYLRWMVRRDALDMGLWSGVSRADLLIPLDTHTFHTARRLGLLQRKSYDLKAVFALTEQLRRFDSADPVRYDFALYRIGQEKLLDLATLK